MNETSYVLNDEAEAVLVAFEGYRFFVRPRTVDAKPLKDAYGVSLREEDLLLARLLVERGYSRPETCPIALAIRRTASEAASVLSEAEIEIGSDLYVVTEGSRDVNDAIFVFDHESRDLMGNPSSVFPLFTFRLERRG